jgi:quercetin dioxygenase-like cupin family protein
VSHEWIEDPTLKLRMRFERKDGLLHGEVEIERDGGIGKHFHPRQQERWLVHEGTVRFRVGRSKRVLSDGEDVLVGAGVRHALKNVGRTTARLRFTIEPALELEPFLVEAAALNRAGKITSFGVPTSIGGLLDGAWFLDRYKDTCVVIFPPPFPPPALQGLMLGPLARFAQRRRAHDEASAGSTASG